MPELNKRCYSSLSIYRIGLEVSGKHALKIPNGLEGFTPAEQDPLDLETSFQVRLHFLERARLNLSDTFHGYAVLL